MAILEEVARDGLLALKRGGVGARELARLAKQLGEDAPIVRLALELGLGLGLFDLRHDGRIGVSAHFGSWRRPPHQQAFDLASQWMLLEYAPTGERDGSGAPLPALGRDDRRAAARPSALCGRGPSGERCTQGPARDSGGGPFTTRRSHAQDITRHSLDPLRNPWRDPILQLGTRGLSVDFESYVTDFDGAPFFKGAPGDMCQASHMGYVIKGRFGVRGADGTEEIFEAGDAFVLPPGHIPVYYAGLEMLAFTPLGEARQQQAYMMPNIKKTLDEMGIALPPEFALQP